LHAAYGEQVEFLVVYIREAHALDGAAPRGGNGSPLVEEPASFEERTSVAEVCVADLDLAPLKTVIDDMDDSTSSAYASFPDRLFLVGEDGRIAYAGERGPKGFLPNALEDAIRVTLELPPVEHDAEPEFPRRRR